MDISAAFAAQSYANARAATEPGPAMQAAQEAVSDFAQTLQQGEDAARAAMTGSADPHTLVQALGEAKFAVETAVTVRDKVVEAYQEILRMPV